MHPRHGVISGLRCAQGGALWFAKTRLRAGADEPVYISHAGEPGGLLVTYRLRLTA